MANTSPLYQEVLFIIVKTLQSRNVFRYTILRFREQILPPPATSYAERSKYVAVCEERIIFVVVLSYKYINVTAYAYMYMKQFTMVRNV